MRPFGCPVTILNTLDPLGKFDGKAEEGFLVGYSINNKAFRVFNSQTRKVEENMHVNFLENKPNVAGQGPNCPKEANGDTDLKKSIDARQSEEKNVSNQQYIVFPLWSSISSCYKSSDETYKNDTADDAASETHVQKSASENEQALKNVLDKMMYQEKEATEQSDAVRKDAFDDEDLDTYNSTFVDQVMGVEANFNSMKPSTVVSPIPTTIVHSIHPKDQIIGDLKLAVQTRGMTKKSSGEHAMINAEVEHPEPGLKQNVDAGQSEKRYVATQSYIVFPLWSSIFSDEKYKNDTDAAGESPRRRLQSNQMLLEKSLKHSVTGLQGKATKASSTNSFNTVSTPVNAASAPRSFNDAGPSFVPLGGSFPLNVNDLPDDPLMPDLENTAEVHFVMSASVALSWGKIEAIRLFFAYASFMNFLVYQMDVKSVFLNDTIEEEVYVSQPLGFVDPEFPEKVYKVGKAPRAWYETLSTYLLDNGFYRGQIDKTLFIKRVKDDIILVQVYVDDIIFGSTKKSLCTDFEQIMHKSIRIASTPMETNKALTKDEDGEDVDVHLYKSMIGSLMYLTSSRPDIMFSVCACSRFQVQPKVSHLNAVKRIFRYLKGRPNLGLWYPKDSPFILEAFSDIDYAGASLDRKSTTEGCQFLGSRLISWQCKKPTVVANSTTEAEYIAASHCCGQVLWIQNQMLDYGYNFMQTKIHVDNESAICVVKNHVYHSKTKLIEIRHHFIRDSYENRLIEMVKIHTDNNVADLLTKAFDVSRFNFLVASICMLNL
ncbi:putative ribonuclease H-like domain-containing protein [Tanacetum coccineum]